MDKDKDKKDWNGLSKRTSANLRREAEKSPKIFMNLRMGLKR